MTLKTDTLPWPISPALCLIIQQELAAADIAKECGAIITFRDPNYTPETGGFHPVEVAIGPNGNIEYITDFAYVGRAPQCEMAKELDFDFSLGLFQHNGVEFPISSGRDLYNLWQSNFLSYHRIGVYTVTVEPMG